MMKNNSLVSLIQKRFVVIALRTILAHKSFYG
jgi:hypothetical protein